MPHGAAGDAMTDLPNVILDHLPARFVFLLFCIALHLLYIRLRVRGQRAGDHLQFIRRDLQIRCKGRNNILPVNGRLQIDVDRQHFHDLHKAVIFGDDYASDDIFDWKPRLHAVTVYAAAAAGMDAFAKNQFLEIHFLTSPRNKIIRRDLRHFHQLPSHRVILSSLMPISPKPPSGTMIVSVTMIFGVRSSGRKAMQRYSAGSVRRTASTRFRSSKSPITRPASVKLVGM